MEREIKLNDILNIPFEEIKDYKIKLNKDSGGTEPLKIMIEDFEEFKNWVAWKNSGNDLPRKYVIALARYYTVSSEQWIFGGVYKVEKKANFSELKNAVAYNLFAVEKYDKYIGRLVVEYKNKSQWLKRDAEGIIDEIKVVEIMKEPYSGIPFNGYENVNIAFEDMQTILNKNIDQWKRKLENITGVYLLTDTQNGKKYVGSAYGQEGIWQRWNCYAELIDGGNKELKKLEQDYIKSNFKISLLEWYKIGTDKDFIINRESYWKDILLTRNPKYGYNDN